MKEIRFAKNLRDLRQAAGYTQKQVASIVSVDQRTVSAWEKGICEPDFKTLSILCELFGETFDNILT